MKRVIYYILTGVLLMFNTACSDYLSEESYTDIDKNNYMTNAAEAQNVLLGVYRNMVVDAVYGYHLSILFPLGTDISQVEGNSNENFRIIPTNSFSANQAEIQRTWAALYNGIYNANDFIEGIEEKMENYSNEDRELATIYIAEARSLRALFYFELLRRYGHIALITNTAMSNQHPSTFVQEEPVKVYEFIEQDLQYAVKNLPYAADDTKRSDNSFRFSKGAALGLLAKVYATWAGYPVGDESKWELAANTAEILITSNKHGLLSDYEQLWKNAGSGIWNPAESLIEASFYSPTAVNGAQDPIGRIGKWNGVRATEIAGQRGRNAGNVRVVHTFALDWRTYPEDLRRDIAIANYQYNPAKVLWVKGANDTDEQARADDADPTRKQPQKQNYTPGKWDTEKYVPQSNALINNDMSNINWYVLRYADVLLLYAEAVNEWKQGPTADAYAAVNMVRRRGYGLPMEASSNLADLPSGLDISGFRDAVRKERAFELAFEGHRKLDLIRWGIYYETVRATAVNLGLWWQSANSPNYVVGQPGYTTQGKHELYPIPQRDMDLMQQFEQNPGW
ncbi:RagB/SusD family nutrient uptake outer membrane protein [Sphingobacterium chuzhouense]|uniref:RagB/SusD family nutrient uptake outer membrane protein n=1 Tax=Sphingobacterium chuzhouense TaxID=1742264 RepID=A0ABR7XWS7_9SPHI|nr:RagB/SusD family nutrient uptake outer membrane protein [Sphingobacterium chuzhouense]MBD1423506.1 RagB/SusD family nutrient uptake outer membrane protein [Sphingobacterium chuzhouense]